MTKDPLYLYLKTPFNEIVKQERFGSPSGKLKLIEKWKKLYGAKFNDLIVEEQAPPVKEKYDPIKKDIPSYGKVFHNKHKTKKGFKFKIK